METLAPVHTFLDRVRGAGVPVIYTVVAGTTTADVLPAVAPKAGEPSFSSGTDKFLNTDLAKSLQDKGIKTVVTLGTGAIGAVLSNSSEAALRGLQVVVAIDGVSDSTLYAEQLTVWTLLNAPVIGPRVTMSRTDLINF